MLARISSVGTATFEGMTTTPDIITKYYAAATTGDLDSLVACFVPTAEVVDEGQSYHGLDEIRGWREDLASAFTYTLDITGVAATGDQAWVVSTHLEGTFPGGVVDLDQRFTLEGGLIASLAI
ncbi:MAG: hypothetical protein JWP74_1440 [Marmoricola sp.]|nr:hypothetical protein [Marmoricola sp.]